MSNPKFIYEKTVKYISYNKDCCHLPKKKKKIGCSIDTVYHYGYKD